MRWRYAFVPDGEEEEGLLGSKAKRSFLKQSVKFKFHIWPEITKKFAKKYLNTFSQ